MTSKCNYKKYLNEKIESGHSELFFSHLFFRRFKQYNLQKLVENQKVKSFHHVKTLIPICQIAPSPLTLP